TEGRLMDEHNEKFLSRIDRMITEYTTIRLLLELKGLKGFAPDELWRQLNFQDRHFQACERLALIAEDDWAEATEILREPFSKGDVKCFPPAMLRKAWAWIKQE
ncbi:MAG: STAS/SEC14 domain-containing protein, partial [Vulcanimicrobiota bacterium]